MRFIGVQTSVIIINNANFCEVKKKPRCLLPHFICKQRKVTLSMMAPSNGIVAISGGPTSYTHSDIHYLHIFLLLLCLDFTWVSFVIYKIGHLMSSRDAYKLTILFCTNVTLCTIMVICTRFVFQDYLLLCRMVPIMWSNCLWHRA